MANLVATAAALRERLKLFTALPHYYPNDPRTPSLDVAPNGFIYSEIRHLDERPMSVGPDGQRRHRDYGEFLIYVFVPKGSHVGTAEGYAETVRDLFKMTTVGDIVCTRRTIGSGSAAENPLGRFWSVPIVVNYHTDRLE